jgi:hypothetical protein
MLTFETADSPHFLNNQQLVLDLQHALPHFEFQGWCNAYGFEINGENTIGKQTMQFKKYQTTRNGVVVPLDALDSTEIHITIGGLPNDLKYTYGGSKWAQLLQPIQEPSAITPVLNDWCKSQDAHHMQLLNGTLTLALHNPKVAPAAIFESLTQLLQTHLNRA